MRQPVKAAQADLPVTSSPVVCVIRALDVPVVDNKDRNALFGVIPKNIPAPAVQTKHGNRVKRLDLPRRIVGNRSRPHGAASFKGPICKSLDTLKLVATVYTPT